MIKKRILFKLSNPKGFTLIELIIVFTLISLLSVISIQSFVDYNRKQALAAATNAIVTALNTARSRALSQVKPSPQCDNRVFVGYQVEINTAGKQINLYVVCQLGSNPPNKYQIPPIQKPFTGFTLSVLDNANQFRYEVLTGAVKYYKSDDTQTGFAGQYIRLDYSGKQQTIYVYPDGRITVQ